MMRRYFKLQVKLFVLIVLPVCARAAQTQPAASAPSAGAASHVSPEAPAIATQAFSPPYWAAAPFVALLLAIALMPLIRRTSHWWEHHRSKLITALLLSLVTGG